MEMPGRVYSGGKYRYGFNGQEKSDEIAANTTTAEFWQYDARIGRRWNTDPVPKSMISPYATLGNNPITYVDPDGADTLTFTKNTTIRKEVRMSGKLDGMRSKVLTPASVSSTGRIDIRKGDGADVFYYQKNTTTIDESGNLTTVNGKLEQFNPTGSSSNFYQLAVGVELWGHNMMIGMFWLCSLRHGC
ncbi:hypothetical protein DXN05_10275 [Deminuibacter soli]|uniref:RHS repeat-associated core domain-containing protein n=2 Tax=Deminuibacter soli TaxID=2291815 RepID=A0A3E1NJC3_9BACT|nr:hypothetical protein DXN05_10275 [Deminuibacter soli]